MNEISPPVTWREIFRTEGWTDRVKPRLQRPMSPQGDYPSDVKERSRQLILSFVPELQKLERPLAEYVLGYLKEQRKTKRTTR